MEWTGSPKNQTSAGSFGGMSSQKETTGSVCLGPCYSLPGQIASLDTLSAATTIIHATYFSTQWWHIWWWGWAIPSRFKVLAECIRLTTLRSNYQKGMQREYLSPVASLVEGWDLCPTYPEILPKQWSVGYWPAKTIFYTLPSLSSHPSDHA